MDIGHQFVLTTAILQHNITIALTIESQLDLNFLWYTV